MKQQKIIFLLLVVTVILTGFLAMSVGYAAVTDNTLKVNDSVLSAPKCANFRVAFTGKPTYTGEGKAILKLTGDRTAVMHVTELKSVGDSVTATFNIKNTSHDISAVLSKSVKNSNKEYFKVTATLSKTKLSPRNGEAILTVKVELRKLPIERVERTYICVEVDASPNYGGCHY